MHILPITKNWSVLKALIAGLTLVLVVSACSSSSTDSSAPTATDSVPSSDQALSQPPATSAPVEELVAANFAEVENWMDDQNPGILWASPNGIAFDDSGNLYTTEFQGNRVRKFSSQGELLLEWGGSGFENGQFDSPTGIAISPDGNVFVSESGNHRIQKFTPEGEWIATFGSLGRKDGQFESAMVLAISDDNLVYVTDWGGGRINVFTTNGDVVGSLLEWGQEPGKL